MGEYVAVYSIGGIITEIEQGLELQALIDNMIEKCKERRFDFEADDARIFDYNGDEVYSFDHEKHMREGE